MKSDFNDPEASYRRGYVHGAYDVIEAISDFLPAIQKKALDQWLYGPVFKWRLQNLRGESTARGDTDPAALPPRHLLPQVKD